MTRETTPRPRSFVVYRRSDSSGVSGVGLVMQGVIFGTGKCIINWLTPEPSGSINIFDSFDMFMDIHVHPHPGNDTRIEFADGEVIKG